MNVIYQLVRRNTLVFLRDKASVFFSFLSVIIIIIMYVLFLGKINEGSFESYSGNIDNIRWLVNSWIMAGILTVSTVTVPLGVLGTLIKDRETGMLNDFYTSPISRNKLAISYLISSWIIGFVLVFANFIVGQLFIVLNGGEFIGLVDGILVILAVILSIITFSSFFFFISLFMKTQRSFGLLSTMIGTFIGFLGGIYIQIGMLSKNVQTVMNLLPSMHSVALIRSLYMREPIAIVFANAEVNDLEDYLSFSGIFVEVNGYQISNVGLVLMLIAFALLFYIFSIIKLMRSKL